MGTIRETVRVKANDDVYQRIIQKQQDAKRESEKKTWDLLKIRNAQFENEPVLCLWSVGGGGIRQKQKNKPRRKKIPKPKKCTL